MSVICQYCNQTCKTEKSLLRHIERSKKCLQKQGKFEFKCEKCSRICSTFQKLNNHKQICRKIKEYELEQLKLKLDTTREVEKIYEVIKKLYKNMDITETLINENNKMKKMLSI
jgi:hypothetical protein